MNPKQALLPFVIGLLLGALIALAIQNHLLHRFGPGAKPDPAKAVERLSHKLNLSPDQKDKIKPVIEDTFKRMDALREQMRPQFKSIREEARQSIRAVLDPDQQAKFDKICEEHDKRMEKRFEEH
jgi:Spy/CpxP family protein refolding chaperone